MDFIKLNNRIIKIVDRTLFLQGLSTIKPVKIITNNGRYYLINCIQNSVSINLIFIRLDKWIFYISGLKKIPIIKERRKYDGRRRIINKPDPVFIKQKETKKQIINKELDKALMELNKLKGKL